jgi:hypothetical protein
MLNFQKLTTVLQITGAALGIPAAAGGTYTVYRSYFASTADCQTLRNSLLSVMDRAISEDSRRSLMKKDLGEFSAKCGAGDPDAMAAFTAAMQQPEIAKANVVAIAPAAPANLPPVAAIAKPEPAKASAADNARPTPGLYAATPLGIFGVSASGEAKGWVALDRRDPEHFGESSFDGFEPGRSPAEKAVLTARWGVPVWLEPQAPGLPDLKRIQGRLARGQCIRVLTLRTASQGRPWADVEPAPCEASAAK